MLVAKPPFNEANWEASAHDPTVSQHSADFRWHAPLRPGTGASWI